MNTRDTLATIKALVTETRPHFDVVIIKADADLSFLDKDQLTNFDAKERAPTIKRKLVRYHPPYYEMKLYQPSALNLKYLCAALSNKLINAYIYKVEVTYDFLTTQPQKLSALISRHFVFLRNNKKKAGKVVNGIYFETDAIDCPSHFTTQYWGARSKHAIVPVLYCDRPSKIAHQPCAHFEFKLTDKACCEAHALNVVSDLLDFDFVHFFQTNARFYLMPSKYVIGQAMAKKYGRATMSRRGYEKYYNKAISKKTSLLGRVPHITPHSSVQRLLSVFIDLKKLLQTTTYKKSNNDFTKNMQNALLNIL